MPTAINDITGDSIKSRGTSKAYEDNYSNIFRKESNGTAQDNLGENVISTDKSLDSPTEVQTPL